MSAHGSNIKQLAFTPLDSYVTSGPQLSMDSAPGRHRAFVPLLTIPAGTLFQSTFRLLLLLFLGQHLKKHYRRTQRNSLCELIANFNQCITGTQESS
ncbi:hypothetical protein TNCV_2642271 [Trichonephila clavipes]|nr:hypothetical protein TNCV_2642271 [Trichonephila clavipes]